MPSWKKVITSGSDAVLNSLYVVGNVTGSSFTGSFVGDGSGLTGIAGVGSGIFAATGSVQATTNNLQITGSLVVSGSGADFKDTLLIRPLVKDYAMEVFAHGTISTNTTINLENGNVHTATIGGALTFTFSNPIASGDATGFVLELTNGGSSTVTFPTSVDWEGGTAPTLTSAGVDILTFYTRDGGTTYHGIVSSLDSK